MIAAPADGALTKPASRARHPIHAAIWNLPSTKSPSPSHLEGGGLNHSAPVGARSWRKWPILTPAVRVTGWSEGVVVRYDGGNGGPDQAVDVASSPDGTGVFATGLSRGEGNHDDYTTIGRIG